MRDTLEGTRKTGIDVIGTVPWGTHICQFYRTKRDLIDILVPYFKAGLESNESCIWITSEALTEKEAEGAMRKAVPNFTQYLGSAQIEIIPYTKWYLKGGAFDSQRTLNDWIDKLKQVLDKGYDGMRVTGDMSWLGEKDWKNFTDYEEEVNNVIGKYHMLAICTYPIDKCGVREIIDVESNHQFALTRQADEWILVGSPEYERLQHDLSERKKELNCLYGLANICERPGITLDELYQHATNLFPQSWQYPDITCAKITIKDKEFKSENYRETEWKQSSDINIHGARTGFVEIGYLEARPEIDEGPFLKEERQLIDAVAEQLGSITERKQAEKGQRLPSITRSVRRLTPLQERFIHSGFEGFDDQEIIELALSLALPHRECQRLAKECIKCFKNLRGFLAASDRELQQCGLKSPCLFCIKLLHELPEEILKEKIIEQPVNKSSQEVFDYLYYSMRDLKKEVFKVIYLNSRNQIIDTETLFEGTIEDTPVHPREIIEAAIKHDAVRLIFVHNHPSGDPTPSKSDKQLTRDLVFIGNVTQIKVLDHLIIGENRYFSFADAGLINKYGDDFLNIRIKRMLEANQNQSPN